MRNGVNEITNDLKQKVVLKHFQYFSIKEYLRAILGKERSKEKESNVKRIPS